MEVSKITSTKLTLALTVSLKGDSPSQITGAKDKLRESKHSSAQKYM